MTSTTTTTTNHHPSQCFDHIFEGWSVWLEPCPETSQNIFEEVNFLRDQCGGSAQGAHSIVPHCTLLYNILPPTTDREQEIKIGKDLLHRSLVQYQQDGKQSSMQQHTLTPTSFYYFDYPKTADHGRGFGCSISMLLLEKSCWINHLQQSVAAVFPPDERHSKGTANFIPHMALVYGAECFGEWLREYTEMELVHQKKHLLSPFPVKYLSLWSTRGKTRDWYRIASVKI